MPETPRVTLDSVVVVTREQVSSDLGDEIAILGLRRSTYYSVTGSGRAIWELLQSRRTVSEILRVLLARYTVDADRCREDLLALLARLHEEGLIEVSDAAAP
jgi:hypothetical protein